MATITIKGPEHDAPASVEQLQELGDQNWMLCLARELDDAILHLRFNELEIGTLLFKSVGTPEQVIVHEQRLLELQTHSWLARETLLYWTRLLKRIDMTSRSLIAIVEHGSCFAGFLVEIVFAVDRSYMMEDEFEDDERALATIIMSQANFGQYIMSNGLSRLQTRFYGDEKPVVAAQHAIGQALNARAANELGLITYAFDDIDWFDEIRVFLEERASFSADALTGMEANLRFPGPETMETKIFGRLTAWQNWIFQRPNAVGEQGALRRYGTGRRSEFDRRRV